MTNAFFFNKMSCSEYRDRQHSAVVLAVTSKIWNTQLLVFRKMKHPTLEGYCASCVEHSIYTDKDIIRGKKTWMCVIGLDKHHQLWKSLWYQLRCHVVALTVSPIIFKQLLDEVFVISRIIKVEVGVISRSRMLITKILLLVRQSERTWHDYP